MQALRFCLSPGGRMRPQPFIYGAVLVYLLGVASQLLTKPDVIPRGGLWLFAAAQALLIWMWFALHAKRLRDSGSAPGLAAAVSLLYALSVVLLVIIGAAFFSTSIAGLDANATSALGLILLLAIYTTLSGAASYDLTWVVVALLSVLAFVPVVLAVAVTLWAATGPSVIEKT
jgi:uncharacterized membrane protein YhaH (DUF805 family)